VKSVGSVEVTSAQLGRGLDMWRGVNAGEPALTRTSVGRDWSGALIGTASKKGPGMAQSLRQ
jgi:hypothetical protein